MKTIGCILILVNLWALAVGLPYAAPHTAWSFALAVPFVFGVLLGERMFERGLRRG